MAYKKKSMVHILLHQLIYISNKLRLPAEKRATKIPIHSLDKIIRRFIDSFYFYLTPYIHTQAEASLFTVGTFTIILRKWQNKQKWSSNNEAYEMPTIVGYKFVHILIFLSNFLIVRCLFFLIDTHKIIKIRPKNKLMSIRCLLDILDHFTGIISS